MMVGSHPELRKERVVEVKPGERTELMKKLKHSRNKNVVINGKIIPNSVSILQYMLSHEANLDKRYALYEHIVAESSIAERYDLEEEFAYKRYLEFGDITSLISYSGSLISNGKLREGLNCAKDALCIAIGNKELINAAAISYIREAIRTGSAYAINESLQALLESVAVPREVDSVLEVDWISDAKKLGASEELISKILMIGANEAQ